MSGAALPDSLTIVAGSSWTPTSAEDREAVLQQLDRMLAHSCFRNSKRYSSLLRYVVERKLRGEGNFKERVLGIEVFAREPDYDTNEDPVVRVTAGEIRRRIAQYYYEAGHDDEIRIELPAGSYNPVFRLAAQPSPSMEGQLISAKVVTEARVLREVQESASSSDPKWFSVIKSRSFRIMAILAVVCVVFAVLWNNTSQKAPLEQFWAPVFAAKSPILICIPDLNSSFAEGAAEGSATTPFGQAMLTLGRDYRRQKVAFSDFVALATLTGLFGRKGADFRVKRSEDASLDDLKAGPVLLIAGANNRWTIQLGKQLRFTSQRDGDIRYVSDAANPSSRQWAVTGTDTTPNQVDYGIISRVFDPTTGGVLVTAAGLHHNGTQAAGICLASEACLRQAEKMASGNWSKANIQFVVETAVLGDDPGQPRVVAANLW